MKKIIVLSLTLMACCSFAAETIEQKEMISIQQTSHDPHAIDLLLSNPQASVWCADYCRAKRNQCLQTQSYSFCTAEFVDCVDSCLDPDNSGGGSGGGGGGNGNPS